ncbi:uncharacterized protein KD926_006300 [Aspergillus affinis]|uniref:uncharacterized protein n=1 Tax=Aspergillus affinis TaxID=1070780 RepID=UPI0022FE6B96|nr:uncharacterized protein KD926_006300 [Aspergillus affinis]KAI9041963.1 hypothetical protein KD926_006300 [Aspergillus affinis]
MKGVALRGQRAIKPPGLICQLCQLTSSPATRPRTQFARSYASTAPLTHPSKLGQLRPKRDARNQWTPSQTISRRYASKAPQPSAPVDPEQALEQLECDAAQLRKSESVPSDESVVQLLKRCQELAETIVHADQEKPETPSKTKGDDVITSLLDLEEKSGSQKPSPKAKVTQPYLPESLGQVAYDILADEKVFISPEALAYYTKTATLLKQADHCPEIFHLYAHKPVPEENSSPIKYHKANPKNINSAVPTELAHMALDVATEQRNLPLVLAIIDTTFCAPAFHRAKVFKKAAVPLGALGTTPIACYAIASWASTLQNTMDASTATGIAFAASLAYVGGVSSIGILAITTANDQMQRVTWLSGVPLRHRWLREEERAALDKVAVKWGFKNISMWGEEEGEEWESLREFIGMRGMILDKTELMPGMQ